MPIAPWCGLLFILFFWLQVISLLVESWTNLLFQNRKDNPQLCHLYYKSILTSWRPHFRVPYFGHETSLNNKLTLGNAFNYPWWFGVVLCQMSMVIIFETFDIGQVLLRLLDRRLLAHWFLLVILKPQLTLAHLHLLQPLFPWLGLVWFFWVTLVLVSPLGRAGTSSSIHSTIFITFGTFSEY